MKNLYRHLIANYVNFFILAALLASSALFCGDRAALRQELTRQYEITELLISHKKKQKAQKSASQALLAGDQEEIELKTNADQSPLTTFACAGEQQRVRNMAYINALHTALGTSWPAFVLPIVTEYARPEPLLHSSFKPHPERVYNLFVQNMPWPSCSYSTDNGVYEVAHWNDNTGQLFDKDTNVRRHKPRPKELLDTVSLIDAEYTDYAYSPDGAKIAATTFDSDLLVWDAGESLMQAVAKKQVVHAMTNSPADKANPFTSVTFSPCGHYLFAGQADGTVLQLDKHSLEVAYTYKHPAAVTALDTAVDEHNNDCLYAGLENGQICIWKDTFLSPTAHTSSEAPQPAGMTDGTMGIRRITSLEDREVQELAQYSLCLDDVWQCAEHRKVCCKLCVRQTKLCASCCKTGALCCLHCPRTCGALCCIGCDSCAQQTCIRWGRCIWRNIKRLWQ